MRRCYDPSERDDRRHMPSRRIELQLESLSAARASGPTPESIATVKKGLADAKNVVLAKAANIAAEWGADGLIPELLATYYQLFQNPRESDPQCWGKNAISQALSKLGYRQSAPFLRGVDYIQMEPVWGGEEDTATTLRSTCLLALAQCSDIDRKDVLRLAVNALTEPIVTVRVDAARLLEQLDGDEAILLLRLKARSGDRELQVIGQVLESLLKLEGAAAVPFVNHFLGAPDDDLFVETALALGASNIPAALESLIDCWTNGRRLHDPNAILRGIALSRLEDASSFLLSLVREAREREAIAAIKALSVHRDSPELRERIAEALHLRPERTIHDFFYQEFGRPQS